MSVLKLFFLGGGDIRITLSVCLSVCSYFLYTRLLPNRLTDTDETFHSYIIQPEDVQWRRRIRYTGLNYFKGDN